MAILDLLVLPVPVPGSLDAPDAWALRGVERVRQATDRVIHGHTDFLPTLAQMVDQMTDAYRPLDRVVAVVGDAHTPEAVVGQAAVRLPQVGDTDVVGVGMDVHPDWRGRGIGSALAEVLAARIASEGRPVVHADTSYGVVLDPTDDGALIPSTGVGAIPAEAPSTRFALRYGFSLEQVDRQSTLALPVAPDHLAALTGDAVRHAGGDYRTHVWVDEIPEAWLAQYAVLLTRMSTATPAGGLVRTEDPWDVERVRDHLDRVHETGRMTVIAVIEHVPSGTLAAYSAAEYGDSAPEAIIQEDTLVLPEHRGRRLGMLVKTALMATLADVRPGARRIHTWNAQENAHMLAINVALGYRPASVEAQWQLRRGD